MGAVGTLHDWLARQSTEHYRVRETNSKAKPV